MKERSNADLSHIARQVSVQGQVQGVFFRASCARAARDHDVAGWVRNEWDGTVSAHFQGQVDAVTAMLDWVHHGPPGAVVDRVDVTVAEVQRLDGFRIR